MKRALQQLVEDFHRKYAFAVDRELDAEEDPVDTGETDSLIENVIDNVAAAQVLSGHILSDLRMARLNLILEETRELAEALLERDRVATADALADLAVVIFGTAVAYGIPLEECFREVMRSNMTKDVDGAHKPRKGAEYSPPNLQRILDR